MTDTPAGTPGPTPPGGPVSDRMQALLSRAVEEQVSEQRAVSNILGELRTQIGALSDGVRLAASEASVERLGGVVSTVVADLRTSTSLLGQRIEALSKRVDAVAQDTAAPTEQAAVRLAALQGDIAAQSDAVERMQNALETLAGFPAALASLQKDVAGLHDRLTPLAEVRATIGDIGARTTSSLQALRPQLEALQGKVDAIGVVPDAERLRDAVVDALSGRLGKLEEAAERPVIGPEALRSGLGDLRASMDGTMGDRLEELGAGLGAGLGAVENRLGQIGERLADVGDAAGGIPALSTDLTRLASRVEELLALRGLLSVVSDGVTALRDDSTGTTLSLGLASVRDDIEQLGERMAELAPPPAEEVAALVSQRVADRLVETLAPRIADVVLTRVSAALVTQLGDALSPRLKADTELVVRAATADSERRVLAHLDEAVLALAEALLRRRHVGRTTGGVALAAAEEPAPAAGEEVPDDATLVESSAKQPAVAEPSAKQPEVVVEVPVQDIVDSINAVEEPAQQPPARPAVTTGLAPARAAAPAVGPVAPEADAPAAEAVPDDAAPPGKATSRGPEALKPAARSKQPTEVKRKPWWRPGG